jgi:uncharacterized protein (TIGR03437 family)
MNLRFERRLRFRPSEQERRTSVPDAHVGAMTRRLATLVPVLLVCASLHAATVNTTLTVTNATGSIGASGLTVSGGGSTTLSGIGSGGITGTVGFAPDGSGNVTGTFTITLTSGTTGTLTGTLKFPVSALQSALAGGPLSGGSATITGGTGNFAGATGSFPSLTGTVTSGPTTVSFHGDGSITTGGGGGGPGGTPTPTVSAVLDAASNTATVAPGGFFIVKGANLSATGLTSYPPPRPTNPSGVKVTFAPISGGAGTDCYIYYLYNQNGVNQIGAILPSTVAPGNYNVTVTSGGTASTPTLVTVVANKLTLFTQDQSGGGLAVIQNYISASQVDINRLTTGSVNGVTISPAHPGQVVIAYGTGLAAYAAGDNAASPAFDFRSSLNVQAIVGGVTIPADYAGLAGYSAEDQINFTLPANVPTGCAVTLQISVNCKLSPATTMTIAPAGSDTCSLAGYTKQQLQALDQGSSIVTGGFSITQFALALPQLGSGKSDSVGGAFRQLTAFNLSSAASQNNISFIQSGSCVVATATSGGSGGGGGATLLDAGTITVTGPGGSGLNNQVLTKSLNSYGIANFEGLNLPGQTSFNIVPGTYTLNGGGGPDVGSFSASLTLSNPVTVTGTLPSTVIRSNPLTINWSGGNPQDQVEIIGGSSVSSGTGANVITTTTSFICLTTAGAGTFTVPTSILSQLPATTGSIPGILELGSGNGNTTFTASLPKLGGSASGTFSNFVGTGAQVTWQ